MRSESEMSVNSKGLAFLPLWAEPDAEDLDFLACVERSRFGDEILFFDRERRSGVFFLLFFEAESLA